MPGNLVFTADGRLLAGGTVLAQVAESDGEGFAQLVVGDHDYDIVRRKRAGWHFELIDRSSGKRTCDFVPFRLRPGGRLTWSDGVVLLRRRPLRAKRWWFCRPNSLVYDLPAALSQPSARSDADQAGVDTDAAPPASETA